MEKRNVKSAFMPLLTRRKTEKERKRRRGSEGGKRGEEEGELAAAGRVRRRTF